jgi:hypothetical protein
MILGLTDETCLIAAGSLYGYVDDAKHFVADMLSHKQSADFPVPGTFQFRLQALDQLAR